MQVLRGRKTGEPVRNAHRTPRGRQGAQNSGGGGGEDPPQLHHNSALFAPEGGWTPPRRKAHTFRALHYRRLVETSLATMMGWT